MSCLKDLLRLGCVLWSIVLLTSCGGDGIGGTGYPLSDLDSAPEGALYRGSEETLSVYFQRSVKLRHNNEGSEEPPVSSDGVESFSGDGAGSVFSSTNIQESGVEEADLIKTNGSTIYSISTLKAKAPVESGENPSASFKEDEVVQSSSVLRVMEPDGNALREVKHLVFKGKAFSGLYLHEESKRLVALASENQNYYINWFDYAYFANQKTEVMIVDVRDSDAASIETTLEFEGTLINSRRNKDTLYLVLRHYPDYQYIDDEKLLDTTVEDFLPTYKVGNASRQLISKAENCFLEKGRVGNTDVITLVAIDLKSQTHKINSRCFVGSVEAFYASKNALYLATTKWGYQVNDGISEYQSNNITTDIHKFAYDGLDFEYRGSGEVKGHLGYKQDSKSFRFSESGDLLRVVTFDEDQWDFMPAVEDVVGVADINGSDEAGIAGASDATNDKDKSPVSISILKENTSKRTLDLIAKLPNENRPEPIGLPGEQLYATRFIGDRAYVVTFRVVDPLYIIDLSNPNDPFIAGELKIDGYSDYLHPISNNLILGIGKDAIPDDTARDGRGAWYQGVKLSLIDVSSPSNPREVDKVIIGKRGTESAVLWDHHAFTGLQVDNSYRVAIPIEVHEEDNLTVEGGSIASTYHAFKNLGLYRFDIDVDAQKIVQKAPMIVSDANAPESYSDFYNDRSVFLNNTVHYMHNGKFWSQDWQGIIPIEGPK